MQLKDLSEVLNIYNERIETGKTFQIEVPSELVWDEGHHATLCFVADQ